VKIICLDLEGVLVPEIWIGVAERTGIDELRLTTRDISDYDVLMKRRIEILHENGLLMGDIHEVIDSLDPLPGARDLLARLRASVQVAIISDTFYQFAKPLMRKLDWPSLYCNNLEIDGQGRITGYRLRQPDQKRQAVLAFKGLNFQVTAAGDSYNDISMLTEAHAGILFRPPEELVGEYPQFPVTHSHEELYEALLGADDYRFSERMESHF
jgi:phosphoserine/homoserine phosphotransferase